MPYHKHIYWDAPDIGAEEIDNVLASISSRWVGSNGPAVTCLQDTWAERMEVEYALAVNNGTSALLVALQAIREEIGELRVGVPTYSFIASANAATEIAKDIVLLDCDPKTWNIRSPYIPWEDINVLMPVDVGGLPCDYDALISDDDNSTFMVADSAESAGATYKDMPVGGQCDIHAFSLHRAKIICAGEGGMVTTNNLDLFKVMKSIANHGYTSERTDPWRYRHDRRGFNYRMTELEAAVALAQINKLDQYIQERRWKAKLYKDRLSSVGMFQADNGTHPYFFFGMEIEADVDWFCKSMAEERIDVKTWEAIHRQPIYHFNVNGRWPNANKLSDRVVLLPIGNTLIEEDVEYIANVAGELLSR